MGPGHPFGDLPGHHIFTTYGSGELHVERVATFAREARESGARVVLLVSDEHRIALARELPDGISLRDAAELCDRVDAGTIQGSEELAAWVDRIAGPAAGNLHIAVESTELFCRRGRYAAALDLERWWNGLVEARAGSRVLCSCSIDAFSAAGAPEVLARLIDLHLQQQSLAFEREVARRVAAEQRMHETDGRFRVMADHAPVFLWLSGTDARCTFFNQGWLNFTGRTMEQEVGDGWAEGVHPDDHDRCLEIYLDAFHNRQPFAMEYRLRRFDGEYRWVYDEGCARYLPDGTFEGYVGSAVDITERRQAVERSNQLATDVHEHELSLKAIIDSALDAIVALDEAGAIELANHTAERMFGYQRGELVGRCISVLLAPADRERWNADGERLASAGDGDGDIARSTRALTCVRRDGALFAAELSLSRYRWRSRAHYVGVIRDLSEQKRNELLLAESEARIRIAVACDLHDSVGQLLAGGKILTQNLARDAPPELQPRIAHVARLLGDALGDVRGASHSLARPEDLQAPLGEALARFAEQASAIFGIRCSALVEEADEELEADPQRRSQAFLVVREAVLNAAKHSDCTTVDIYLEQQGGWTVVRVRDDGKGPPATRSDGIGLASMEYRARLLGGELNIRPLGLGGTEVVLRWPSPPARQRDA